MGRRRAAFEPRGKDQRQQQRRRHPLALGSEHEAKRDDGLPREERRLQGEGPRFGSRPRAQGEGLLREGSEQAHPRNVMVGGVTSHISRAPAREALTQQCHCGPVTAVLVYRLLTHNYLQFFFSFGEKKKKKKKKKKS